MPQFQPKMARSMIGDRGPRSRRQQEQQKNLAKVTRKIKDLELTMKKWSLAGAHGQCGRSFNCPNQLICASTGISTGLIYCNKYFFPWRVEEGEKA